MSVYNGQKFLEKAIRSILNQTFSDFEFIIINDASTDQTPDIIKSFSDNRIFVIHHSRNVGLTRSLIEGVNRCRGPYIARMDGDDISCPGRIEILYKFFQEKPSAGAVGSFVEFMNDSDKTYWGWELPQMPSQLHTHLLSGNSLSHGSMMFKRDVYQKAGGYRTQFQFAQDFDLWLRISEISEISVINQFLYRHRRSPDRLSARYCHQQIHFMLLALMLAEKRRETGIDYFTNDLDFTTAELFALTWKYYAKNKEFYQDYLIKNSNKIVHELYSAGHYWASLKLKFKTKCILHNFRRFYQHA